MNIMYIIGQLRHGGQETQLYYLLKNIDRKNFFPNLVVWNYRSDEFYVKKIKELKIKIYSLGNSNHATVKLFKLRKLVSDLQPQILHSYSFYTNFIAHLSCINLKTIAIGSIRSSYISSLIENGQIYGRLNVKFPAHQISNNFNAMKEIEIGSKFWIPKDLKVITNGIETDIDYSKSPSNDKFNIIGIGSLSPIKNWELLIDICNDLLNSKKKFNIIIVGDGPTKSKLQSKIDNFDIGNYIQLVGKQDNVEKFIQEAHLLVHVSKYEGFPNVIMEAMVYGKPIIASDVGDISFMVKNGLNGYVIKELHSENFYKKILKIMNDKDLLMKMGKESRKVALKLFSMQQFVSKTIDYYDRIKT